MERDICQKALESLNSEAKKRGIKLEIALYGGAAMLLRFDESERTQDLDAAPKNISKQELFSMSLDAGEFLGLEPGWINSAVSIFASSSEKESDFDCLDIGDNLTVHLASPEYLLAMKILAMRTGQDSHDVRDINILIDHLRLQNAEEALEIARSFYPEDKIGPESIEGIKAIFSEREKTLLPPQSLP